MLPEMDKTKNSSAKHAKKTASRYQICNLTLLIIWLEYENLPPNAGKMIKSYDVQMQN